MHNLVHSDEWAEVLKRLVKAERVKSGLSFEELSQSLKKEFGTEQNIGNLKSKFTKGNFGAQLLLQLLCVFQTEDLSHRSIRELLERVTSQSETE